jgi:menaquinol-cytochrome c reductase iron-sulfur subunit
MDTSPDGKMDRRGFMKTVIAGIGGLIGAAIGLPAIAYVVGPSLKKETDAWIRLGSVAKVELNTPTLFKTNIEKQTGWINAEEEFSVYVSTTNGRDFVAMSNVCSHLGCRVRWIADKDHFFCPCHNGIYAKDGSVVSGPPPKALARFEVKIENDILYAKRG